MLKKNNIDEKSDLELEQAKHFMQWVTLHEPSSIKRLDKKKDRKRPDFAFYYAWGQPYILELTRWLTSELRQLEAQLEKSVAKPLQDRLDGTFALYTPLETFRGGRLPSDVARQLVSEIEQRCVISGLLEHIIQYKGTSIRLNKLRNDGHRLVPVITIPELPPYLRESDKEVKILRNEIEKILCETDKKFRWYHGKRVLLVDMSQCGLDIEYHAYTSKEGPAVVHNWVAEILTPETRIDYVVVTQYRVWGGSGGWRRVVAGHKYVDKSSPSPKEVWRRPGFPPIHQSFKNRISHAVHLPTPPSCQQNQQRI